MNELKDALDSRLKNITFSQQMKDRVLEECRQGKNAGLKSKQSFKRMLVPITLFLIFCISIGVAIKGLKSNESVVKSIGEIVLLEPDVVYSQYDVTGDGKEDTFKVEILENNDEALDGTMQILLNNKIIFEQKRELRPVWEVKLIKLANGEAFFDIDSTINDDDNRIHQLYICENDALKSVYDFQKYYSEYTSNYSVDIVKVSGNTIETEVYTQFHVTGIMQYDMNLNYKDGNFERTSNEFIPKYKEMSRENKWTVEKKINVYNSVSSKKVAYTLKKGNIVKLDKVIYKNEEVYFQIEDNRGKSGYIIATKIYTDKHYFEEAEYLRKAERPLKEDIIKEMEKQKEMIQ